MTGHNSEINIAGDLFDTEETITNMTKVYATLNATTQCNKVNQ